MFFPTGSDIRRHFFHRLLFSVCPKAVCEDHFLSGVHFRRKLLTVQSKALMPRSKFEFLNANIGYKTVDMNDFCYDASVSERFAQMDAFYANVRQIMMNAWSLGSELTVDELVLPYAGCSRLPTFTPRKPHNRKTTRLWRSLCWLAEILKIFLASGPTLATQWKISRKGVLWINYMPSARKMDYLLMEKKTI